MHSQVLRGEGEKPEVIAVRPVAMRGTRAAVAQLPKIVDRLFHFCVLRGPDRKFHRSRWNVVGRPMVPCAGGRIGIVTEHDETPRSGWRAGPLQRRGEVVPIAGKASRNDRTIANALDASSICFLLQAAGDIASGLTSSWGWLASGSASSCARDRATER